MEKYRLMKKISQRTGYDIKEVIKIVLELEQLVLEIIASHDHIRFLFGTFWGTWRAPKVRSTYTRDLAKNYVRDFDELNPYTPALMGCPNFKFSNLAKETQKIPSEIYFEIYGKPEDSLDLKIQKKREEEAAIQEAQQYEFTEEEKENARKRLKEMDNSRNIWKTAYTPLPDYRVQYYKDILARDEELKATMTEEEYFKYKEKWDEDRLRKFMEKERKRDLYQQKRQQKSQETLEAEKRREEKRLKRAEREQQEIEQYGATLKQIKAQEEEELSDEEYRSLIFGLAFDPSDRFAHASASPLTQEERDKKEAIKNQKKKETPKTVITTTNAKG